MHGAARSYHERRSICSDRTHYYTTGTLRRQSFLKQFTDSNGPPQIIVLVALLALGFKSAIGVVPDGSIRSIEARLRQ